MKELNFDIIIVGSGIVGALAAIALAKQTRLQIAVLDSQKDFPHWERDQYEPRVSAISLASKRIFQSLSIWQKIKAKRISPYLKMQVWDAAGDGEISFDCHDHTESALGYIIEDQVIRESLHETFSDYPQVQFLHPVELVSLEKVPGKINLIAQDGQIFSAKLVIAADGAHSWVREQLSICMDEHEYGHTALVTTVKTELPHQATAWQRFLPTGPLAFLPLEDAHHCSIVWSTSPEIANQLMSSKKTEFYKTLGESFDFKLGKITHCDKRYSFPLHMRHAKNYVQDHIALIGDAAHTIHPLAGQGVNLGLLDAASLAQIISEALQKSRDFSGLATLRRYERWRKSDNALMLSGVEFIKQFFANEKQAVTNIRNLGLNLVDHLSPVKNLLVNHALGNRGDLPEIAQKTT